MRATARLVARADRHGRTIATELRGESPLLLRQVPSPGGGVTVYVVGGAAGPLAGDDLRLDIEVGPGAVVRVHTVAASIALPGRPGAVSRTLVRATVADRAALFWLPEQLIAAAGCAHVADSQVDVAEGGALHWRDELICGRHGERPGDVEINTWVDLAGRPLLRQSLAVGSNAPGWAGPAVLAGASATGSLLVVDPSHPVEPPAVGATWARLPLAGGPATLWSATAPDAHTLRGYLERGPEVPPGQRRLTSTPALRVGRAGVWSGGGVGRGGVAGVQPGDEGVEQAGQVGVVGRVEAGEVGADLRVDPRVFATTPGGEVRADAATVDRVDPAEDEVAVDELVDQLGQGAGGQRRFGGHLAHRVPETVGEQAEHPPRLDAERLGGEHGADPAREQPLGAGQQG